jgi:hypothetical protein
MYAYADQNFLSTCVNSPSWKDSLVQARNNGTATLVMSPWHFYEVGNPNAGLRDELLKLAEDIRPAWTFAMADMQLLEVFSEWKTFWGNGTTFEPIGTLAEVAGALHNIHPGHFSRATLKQWIDVFAADDGVDIEKTLDFVCQSHAQNQQSFKRGRMTKDILRRMDQMHIAIQLARSEQNGRVIEAMKLAEQILSQQPDATRIEFFVDFGGMVNLKCYQVESALAENLWASTAQLKKRYIDRQHATVALPYCDRFITDDGDLTKRCLAATKSLRFSTAQIQRGEEFILSL